MTPKKDRLQIYRSKRNLSRTPEPSAEANMRLPKKPIFVIHKHEAHRLHYDLRLEIDNVLVSWAVPKGPSLNPEEKRLAVRTEDHPMDYAEFEGVIPVGNYGAGTVMVWDNGLYKHISAGSEKSITIEQAIKQGKIEIFLYGQKVYGAFALIRWQENWLLIKERDEYASKRKNPVNAKNRSILTGRTMAQIRRDMR